MLFRHYEGAISTLTLLDKEGVSSEIYYDFHAVGAFYNSLSVAKNLLVANAVPAETILTVDADKDGYPKDREFDIILSMLSCGYHYPLETYLDSVESTLSKQGILIVDVRNDSGGEAVLGEKFSSVEAIERRPKYARLLATER